MEATETPNTETAAAIALVAERMAESDRIAQATGHCRSPWARAGIMDNVIAQIANLLDDPTQFLAYYNSGQ